MKVISNNNLKCTIALASLQSVTDPEIGLNIVDLGLVYQVDFDEAARKIFLTMTLTTQFCPMGETIVTAATRALHSTFPGEEVVVELTFYPPWNHEMISAEGQTFLNA